MSSKAVSHPNIAKITRQIELVDAYYLHLHFYDAFHAIRVIMCGLKPEHKRLDDYKKLLEEIEYSIRRVNQIRYLNTPDSTVKRMSLASQLDNDFHSRFMSLLWDCNMLSEGAYEFFDSTEGKDPDKVVIDLGDRNTTGIR